MKSLAELAEIREKNRSKVILPDGSKQYADREIDIDLIQAYNDAGEELRCNTPTLTLPHPRMNEREFVLIPLQQLRQ